MQPVDIRACSVEQAEEVEAMSGVGMSEWFKPQNQLKVMRCLLVVVGGNDEAAVKALPVLELGDYVTLGNMDEDPQAASGTPAESSSPGPSALRPTG